MASAYDFEVEGVVCRPQNNWLVNVGMNVPKKDRILIKFKTDPLAVETSDRDKIVKAHKKWPSTLAALTPSANGETLGGETVGGETVGSETVGGESAHRPVTRGGGVPMERFSESEYSTFSDYELSRLGARHDRVRDVSYAEAAQKLEEMGLQAEAWLHEVRRVVFQMDLLVEEIPPEHAAAARALQEALIEMVVEAEDEDEADDGEPVCEPDELCEPCDTADAEPTDSERRAAAYFEEVTEAVGWSTEGAPPSPPLA
eukprot:2068589-Prymnesium_polylepis.1